MEDLEWLCSSYKEQLGSSIFSKEQQNGEVTEEVQSKTFLPTVPTKCLRNVKSRQCVQESALTDSETRSSYHTQKTRASNIATSTENRACNVLGQVIKSVQ